MLRKYHGTGVALTVALLLTGGMLSACGGGGGGGGSDADEDGKDLVVVRFSLIDQAGNPTGATGTTNAYRNNRLMFTFSEKVDESMVSDRTIQVGIPSGTDLFLTALGRFEVDGNVVIFDPNVTVIGGPHPFGFEADSTYSVTVKGLPETKTVQSEVGDAVVSSFLTSFTTTDLYLPDHDQPEITAISPPALDANSVAHLLSQTPEERKLENDAGGIWEAVWVESGGDVVLEFSEAMNPATFDPETSFTITNSDRGREVLGVFRFSDDARTVTFRPTFGYGRGPYVIRVDVTVDLTDLAGNPISNPQQWYFLTEYDPTAVNEGVMEEYFDDNSYEDTSIVSGPNGEALADWNPPQEPGVLKATWGTRTVRAPYQTGPSANSWPWYIRPQRVQEWYRPSELGSAGTVTGVSWIPSSASPGSVFGTFNVKLGHCSNTTTGLISATFASNYNVGSPVTVVNNVNYTFPANIASMKPTPFPTFTNTFAYDGQNSVVLEVSQASLIGSTASWRYQQDQYRRRAYHNSSNTAPVANALDYCAYLVEYSFRTETSMAQSLWYVMDSANPMFLDPIINPAEQPAGTETVILFEGALDDGTGQVDPTTATGFIDEVTDLDGYQYIRFRTTFTANLGTGVGPEIEDIVIPYIFF